MIITSEERSAGKALKPCSARDAPERMFNPGKSFPGNRSMPAYPEEFPEDRTPAAFPPRIVRNRMCSKPGNAEEKMAVQANYTEAPAAIREPEKLKCSLRQREFTEGIIL